MTGTAAGAKGAAGATGANSASNAAKKPAKNSENSKTSKPAKKSPRNGGKRRKGRLRTVCTVIARILVAIAVVGCLCRMLPASFQALPMVPVIVAFSPWFLVVAGIALVLALASRRWMTVFLAVLCICAQVYWQSPYYRWSDSLSNAARTAVSQVKHDTDDAYARVMTANVFKGNADADDIVELVRDNHVEVLALQEITQSFVDRLDEAGIESYLPYAITASIGDGGIGNGLWSATPMSHMADAEISSVASRMPAATLTFAADADGDLSLGDGEREIRFVCVHTTSPKAGQWSRWKTSIEQLRQLTERTGIDYVLMGDFNSTTDHAPFREVLGDRYKDAAESSGSGLEFTWPNDWGIVPPFAGIDHIVVEDGVAVGQVEAKSIGGSDHKALLATLDFSTMGE
ncbi:endonuclease/exonuclease/phosphatase family protein [Bifidobacterium choloepi]|uniref:Endonuclease/exonuclease/phosphatase family protein n=1 Tax=Bifidobacterium choloepi TaxID=2614131 RepID=A0A6I5N1E0_9BIFI|nr:endonuclease/exonuclease/phosphatase family protein [Bifidobacterium choloepi]NEG70427.1 endonuclease/exonuclease/phosphatase family protein [Bifidobacterium choloepi]